MKLRALRHSIRIPTTLTTDGGEIKGMILDLSSTGAKLWLSAALADEQIVLMNMRTLSVPATVKWSGRNAAGLAFSAPLSKREIAVLTGRAHSKSEPVLDQAGPVLCKDNRTLPASLPLGPMAIGRSLRGTKQKGFVAAPAAFADSGARKEMRRPI